MKRILVFLIIIIVLISTDSCNVKEKYRLLHQEDEITCVSIVTLTLDETGLISEKWSAINTLAIRLG